MQVKDRIGRRLKLHDLHVLIAVVKTGSMSRAAAMLNTTQPNVSRSVAELEAIVGVRLFDRTRGGVVPTQYGRALVNGGEAAFDELRQAIANIEFLANPMVGKVSFGYIATCAPFVSATIARLASAYPRIVFDVVVGETLPLHARLIERELDLVIARKWRQFSEDEFDFTPLYDDIYAVVASAESPWGRRRRLSLAERVDEPWVLPPPEGSVLGSLAQSAFKAAGVEFPRAAVIALPHELRMELVATGRFLTILSTSMLKFSVRRPALKVLPVPLAETRAPNGIVTLKRRTMSPVARLFIERALEGATARST